MLTIKPDQMAAFEAAQSADFERQLAAMITATYPEYATDQEGVVAVVTVAAADARGMGLSGGHVVGLYVLAAFLLGMSIRDDPRIQAALRDSRASETTKALWLEQWLAAIGAALDGE